MAGVESQVIFRILEQYGHKAFEMDPETCFADKQEYYDFSYMLIVLHTQQHNKAIKQKSNLALFQGQAKEMVPNSYDRLPPDLVESCFQKITEKEIKAPVSRNLLVSPFDINEMNQDVRLRQIRQCEEGSSGEMSAEEFSLTTDLTQSQLFDKHNQVDNFLPEPLLCAALKHIAQLITVKCLQISRLH